jgi:hypothetical protein
MVYNLLPNYLLQTFRSTFSLYLSVTCSVTSFFFYIFLLATLYLHNFIEPSRYWKAESRSATQEIHCLSSNSFWQEPPNCTPSWSSWIQFPVPNCNFLRSIFIFYSQQRSWDSSVGIETGCGLDERGVGVRVPIASIIFSTSSRLALGSTQPPIQWVPGALNLGVNQQGNLTTHLQLVPRSRKYVVLN